MLKRILILVILNSLVFNSFAQYTKLKISTHLADTLTAGEEAILTLNFQKPDIRSYAVYEQKMPAGFTVTAVDTKTAEFKFTENKIILSWIRLPQKNNFSIRLKVKPSKTLSGKFLSIGNITYLVENCKGIINSDTLTVEVIKNTKKITEKKINENQKKSTSNKKEKAKQSEDKNSKPACKRVISKISGKKTETYIVSLFFSNQEHVSTARITEIVPKNYKPVILNAGKSDYTINDNTIILIWDKMPADKKLRVSYELKSVTKENTKPKLTGSFSYAKDHRVVTAPIAN